MFTFQWAADGPDIQDAKGNTYTLADADEGKAISVQVSFTNNAENEETLTGAATYVVHAAPPPPLTASLENAATSHDGESMFTYELQFCEEFGVSYKRLREHALTENGAAVKRAKRPEQSSNLGRLITVRPNGSGDVTVVLPETTDCDDQGAICTGDGRLLSNRQEPTVSGPGG